MNTIQSKKKMWFEKEYLDVVLVPFGLMIVFSYHLYLLYRVLYRPYTTIIGFMNQDKRIWVDRIMKAREADLSNALTVLSSSISTATFLASISLTLSSLIGAWLGSSSTSAAVFTGKLIYGDTGPTTMIFKYVSLLLSFLVAFSCFVQATRHFVHANYLLTTPGNDVPPELVKRAVVRGGDFWSLGLRALYLALDLLLWFFGPIPMFVNSIVMVIILYFLDSNSMEPPLHHRRFQDERVIKRISETIPEPLIFR